MNLVDLQKLIVGSEAWQIRNRINKFQGIFYVFDHNFEELQKFLARYEGQGDDSPDAWLKYRNDKPWNVHREIDRLLLNFLASAKAYVDRTRSLMKSNYKDEPIFESYRKQVEVRFKGNILIEFVEGLRNYTLHHAIPFTSAHMHVREATAFEGYEFHNFFALDRNTLLSDWDQKGKEYLRQVNNTLVIHEFTQEYHSQVGEFQSWLEHKLDALHKKELDWLTEKAAEYDKAYAPLKQQMESHGKTSLI